MERERERESKSNTMLGCVLSMKLPPIGWFNLLLSLVQSASALVLRLESFINKHPKVDWRRARQNGSKGITKGTIKRLDARPGGRTEST